jgi:hypothetical protein
MDKVSWSFGGSGGHLIPDGFAEVSHFFDRGEIGIEEMDVRAVELDGEVGWARGHGWILAGADGEGTR